MKRKGKLAILLAFVAAIAGVTWWLTPKRYTGEMTEMELPHVDLGVVDPYVDLLERENMRRAEDGTIEHKPVEIMDDLAKPDRERLESEEYWREFHLPLAVEEFRPPYMRGGDRNTRTMKYIPPRLEYIATRLAVCGKLEPYVQDGEAVLPLEDYFSYEEKYYGQASTDRERRPESGQEGVFDWEQEIVRIPLPPAYDSRTHTRWKRQLSESMSPYEIVEITAYDEAGTDKVRIVLEDYGSDRERREANYVRTYVFAWEDEVGFVVESGESEWAVTDRVRFHGNVEAIPTLWDLTGESNVHPGLGMTHMGASYPLLDGRMARLRWEEDRLLADTLDLGTLEQETDRQLFRQVGETILSAEKDWWGVAVITNAAVYRLDERGNILFRHGLRYDPEMMHYPVLAPDGSALAFSKDDGVYLWALGGGEQPSLLRENPESEEIVSQQYQFPLYFVNNDYLLMATGMWESIGYFRLIDRKGTVLEEYPYSVAGLISGGSALIEREAIVFLDYFDWEVMDWRKDLYVNLISRERGEPGWLLEEMEGRLTQAVPSAGQLGVWYFSAVKDDETGIWPGETTFYRADFGKGLVEQLPVRVERGGAALLTVGVNNELVFAYAYKGEQGFGVYRPDVE